VDHGIREGFIEVEVDEMVIRATVQDF